MQSAPESFVDATPEKGVIIVEYYWEPARSAEARGANGQGETSRGIKSSLVFFKRVRAADKCWCGSKRPFSRCHRRADDWTFVTLDPDQRAFSPVVLIDRRFLLSQPWLADEPGSERLLPIEQGPGQQVWAVATEPIVRNEAGQLILGTVAVYGNDMMVETNGEKRMEYLTNWLREQLKPELIERETRRAEPQRAFPPPGSRTRVRR